MSGLLSLAWCKAAADWLGHFLAANLLFHTGRLEKEALWTEEETRPKSQDKPFHSANQARKPHGAVIHVWPVYITWTFGCISQSTVTAAWIQDRPKALMFQEKPLSQRLRRSEKPSAVKKVLHKYKQTARDRQRAQSQGFLLLKMRWTLTNAYWTSTHYITMQTQFNRTKRSYYVTLFEDRSWHQVLMRPQILMWSHKNVLLWADVMGFYLIK